MGFSGALGGAIAGIAPGLLETAAAIAPIYGMKKLVGGSSSSGGSSVPSTQASSLASASTVGSLASATKTSSVLAEDETKKKVQTTRPESGAMLSTAGTITGSGSGTLG